MSGVAPAAQSLHRRRGLRRVLHGAERDGVEHGQIITEPQWVKTWIAYDSVISSRYHRDDIIEIYRNPQMSEIQLKRIKDPMPNPFKWI